MALSILNNIPSLVAQNQLATIQTNLQKTLFRLASGSRITSGADDAAGLGIADGLHANIMALAQSQRNANDGVGQLQVADGALSQVTSLLNRAITLATEAATGTVNNSERLALDAEYTQIKNEIDRIGLNTTFNGTSVFTASATSVFLSDSGSSSSIVVSVGTLTANGLLGAGTSASSATNTLTLTSNLAAGSTVTVGSTTYTFQAGAAGGAGEVQIGGTAAATLQNLAAAVNGNSLNSANASATASASGNAITFTGVASGAGGNGVTATGTLTAAAGGSAGTWSRAGALGGGSDAQAATATLGGIGNLHNGDTLTLGNITYTIVNSISGPTVNNQVQVLIGSDEFNTETNLASAINHTGTEGTDYSTGTVANPDATAGPLWGSGNNVILGFTAIPAGASGDATAIACSVSNAGGSVSPFSGGADGASATDALTLTSNLAAGNSVTIGSTTYTFQTGAASGAGEVQIGGTAAETLQNLASAVNGNGLNSANASTTASASGTTITFTATASGSAGNGVTASGTLTSGGGSTGTWSNGGALAGGSDASGSAPSDLQTPADAQAALAAINQAINQVASTRGTLGATINRLQAASAVMSNQVQNLSSAEDGIRATDIPKTVADMAKYNILQQTSMAALAQANSGQQSVLSLLR